jgi:inner membrane transporter RhtA
VDKRYPVLLPVCGLLVALISIQSGAALAKSLFPVLGVLGTTSVRLVLGAIVLALFLKPWRARLTANNWLPLLVYGVSLSAMNITFYLAIVTLPLGVASAIQFLGPLTVAVVYSRRPSDFAWAALAGAGLLLLTQLDGSLRGLDPEGVLWALAAATSWALYIVFGQKAGAHHGTQTASLGMIIAALIALPIGIAEAGPSLGRIDLLPIALAVAVLSSAIPFSLEMSAMRQLPARSFGTLMSLEPVIGAFVGLIFLQEALTLIQWLAISCIVIASIGTSVGASTARE